MSPEELRGRAYRMQALLDDGDIQAAFEEMEAEIYQAWKTCFNADERQSLWETLRGLERLQTWMRSAASYDLTAIQRRSGRA